MVVLYNYPGCASGRKAKKWLSDHQIQYKEKDISKVFLTKKKFKIYLLKQKMELKTLFQINLMSIKRRITNQ